MCVVIDACVFQYVTDKNGPNDDIKPLLDWIENRSKDTSLVIGGTDYMKELKRCGNMLRYISILKDIRKLSKIANDAVDRKQEEITSICCHGRFNDPHIVALLSASGCKLLATYDNEASDFIRDRRFYSDGRRPSIYKIISRHRHLLCDDNIVSLFNVANA